MRRIRTKYVLSIVGIGTTSRRNASLLVVNPLDCNMRDAPWGNVIRSLLLLEQHKLGQWIV